VTKISNLTIRKHTRITQEFTTVDKNVIAQSIFDQKLLTALRQNITWQYKVKLTLAITYFTVFISVVLNFFHKEAIYYKVK